MTALVPVGISAFAMPWIDIGVFEEAVRAANGWSGLLLIFAYSLLIAVVLPLPSEVVLVPALHGTLKLGVPTPVAIAFVVIISGMGKALGSLIALAFGHRASRSGPVLDAIHALGYEPVEWSKNRVVELVRRHGYGGLALGLSIPGFPDTLSIYAFSVFDLERTRFAVASFVGSVGRLLVVLFFFKGMVTIS